MKIFDILSRIPFLRSYASKFLLVAFLGTHVPLIGIVFLILFGESDKLSPLTVLLMMLVFTIVGAAATLATLHYLLEPVRLVSGSLRHFIQNGKPPELPVHYQDEVGQLIKDTQMTLKTQSRLLREQKDLMSVIAHDIRSPSLYQKSGQYSAFHQQHYPAKNRQERSCRGERSPQIPWRKTAPNGRGPPAIPEGG
ncbi:MAG: hypothetical protein BRD50_07430 [Bacteroidetes bacterium SW_11_45_7]|nr:MAG: hypothetical protein BRD50_07430 [Bacteroidetes bacterium SW_11_45_7]